MCYITTQLSTSASLLTTRPDSAQPDVQQTTNIKLKRAFYDGLPWPVGNAMIACIRLHLAYDLARHRQANHSNHQSVSWHVRHMT